MKKGAPTTGAFAWGMFALFVVSVLGAFQNITVTPALHMLGVAIVIVVLVLLIIGVYIMFIK